MTAWRFPGAAPGEIPVFVPHIGVDTIKAVTDAFDVGWLGMGATTREFEQEIERFLQLNDRHVVATNTGTSALHLAVVLAGIGPGDEVIVPSFNFVADHQAVSSEGGEVVFCDIAEDDLGADPASIESVISARTKAIMPLHFAGIPCRINEIYAIAAKHGLRVIEDGTHSFGSAVDGRPIGSFGDLACFSFDPVKVITSIDGGALVVGDEESLERARRLRLLGIDRDTAERYKNKRAWDYDVVERGFRYHMTNINAAVGLSQLRRIDELIEDRRSACRLYNQVLSDVPEVVTPQTDFAEASPFIYTIRVLGGMREKLIDHLRDQGIATGIHFMPAHEYRYYASARRADMSVTTQISKEILTLPLHASMTAAVVESVAGAVRGYFGS